MDVGKEEKSWEERHARNNSHHRATVMLSFKVHFAISRHAVKKSKKEKKKGICGVELGSTPDLSKTSYLSTSPLRRLRKWKKYLKLLM